jgi:YkoY family integral membrane protein
MMEWLLHALQLDTFVPGDLLVVGVVIVLHCLLSLDNAVVLALMVRELPKEQQGSALRWGLIGAYVFRILALVLAVWIMSKWYLKLIGGAYLVYLAVSYFSKRSHGEAEVKAPRWKIPGLSAFWSTVVAVELADIVFSVDSIAATIALSGKLWILITGSFLGILAIRYAALGFVTLLSHFPRLEGAAFAAVGLVGALLMLETPVDVVRQPTPAADASYATAKDYERTVGATAERLLELHHVIIINARAPEAPRLDILSREQRRLIEDRHPELPNDRREQLVAQAAQEEFRLANAQWNLHYRPFLEIESWLVSLVVLGIFGVGFTRRAPPDEAQAKKEQLQSSLH